MVVPEDQKHRCGILSEGKTMEEKMKLLLENVCTVIMNLINDMKPSVSVMIAVDGVAPFAKQTQQRQRRYIAARDRPLDPNAFDSCMISPGTSFMFALHHRLIKLSMSIKKIKGITVIYSSYMTPGEGEHKLLDRIRYESTIGMGIDNKRCIVGPDGDLLVLGLVLPVKNLFLAREDMTDTTLYNVIDVSKMRSSLHSHSKELLIMIETESQKKYLNDFLVVCSIFGNDFLPRIQMFTHLAQGSGLHPIDME